jgi:hypothetical protein
MNFQGLSTTPELESFRENEHKLLYNKFAFLKGFIESFYISRGEHLMASREIMCIVQAKKEG